MTHRESCPRCRKPLVWTRVNDRNIEARCPFCTWRGCISYSDPQPWLVAQEGEGKVGPVQLRWEI